MGGEGIYLYFQLHNEDDPSESSVVEQPSTSTETAPASQAEAPLPEADASPPPYCSIAVEAASAPEMESPNDFYPVPPPYSVATSLPTYDEAEKAKAAAMAAVAAEAAAQRVSDQFVRAINT
uniref:Uncharacterized protein n=1 Tax=Sphaerodactylus townsendi TaxID=933632 RepID=A0ACB8FIU6_9SAUR